MNTMLERPASTDFFHKIVDPKIVQTTKLVSLSVCTMLRAHTETKMNVFKSMLDHMSPHGNL